MGIYLHKLLHRLIKLRNRIFWPFLLLYIAAASLAAYQLEPATFGTYFNAVYWVFTTLATVGFGDFAPRTTAGRALTIGLYITGIGLISIFIGKIMSTVHLIEKLKAGGRMNYNGKDHIILIGWSEKTKLAVDEIFKSNTKTEIVIIDNLETIPLWDQRVHYVRGEASDLSTLQQANLIHAKGVIIFADEKTHDNKPINDPLLIDGKTLLIAAAITAVEEKLDVPIHVTVEVINEKHIGMFKHVKVDEFIPAREMVSFAAVRSLFSHGITNVYSELMSTQYAEGMYEISKRPEWGTYREAFLDLLEKGVTLVADRGDLHINQRLDKPIPEDARLFVIGDKETLSRIDPHLLL